MIIGRFPKRMGEPAHIPAHIEFQATAGSNTLHLRTQTGGYNCTIEWGDGTSTTVPANGGNVIHNYTTAGRYHIYIRGKSFAGFYVNAQTGKEKYIVLHSMGKWEVDTAVDFSLSFFGCNKLANLSKDVFRYNVNIQNFQNCFRDCYELATISANLFLYNVNATNFSFCFTNDRNLQLRSDMFGFDYAKRFAGKSINFGSAFERGGFQGVQGMAPELWQFIYSKASYKFCFGGDGNRPGSISNYDSIPYDWKETYS